MFLRNDIYSSSGSTKLWNCWTQNVTKFDTSSFYNWEEDNQPIYDLEERTYLLWEKDGFPSSSIPGLALVVSADAPASVTGCNRNIFATVSACVAALPNIINFPVLIEIANFGSLGDLNLYNLKFGPRGSIEVINRNFGRAEPRTPSYTLNSITFDTDSPYADQKYVLSVSSDIILGYRFGPREHLVDSSALSISTKVLSSTIDSRMDSNLNSIVVIPPHYGINKSTLSINVDTTGWHNGDTEEYIYGKAYEYSPAAGENVDTYDVSTFNEITKTNYTAYTTPLARTDAVGLFYGNKFNKVSVINCDGPIYLRDLCVDGLGYLGNVDYGFEVLNSPNIFIEDCMSIRCKKAGFLFDNSRITVSRGLVACRNYGFTTSGSRTAGTWGAKKFGSYYAGNSYLSEGDGAGVLAINSNIFVSSTSGQYRSAMLLDSTLSTLASAGQLPIQHLDYIFLFSKNNIGIKLVNSKLSGGYSHQPTFASPEFLDMFLTFECNDEDALVAENSELYWNGSILVHSNNRGMSFRNSIFKFEKLIPWLNQKYGVRAVNSELVYNKGLTPQSNDSVYQNYDFSGNGQHIILENSQLYPKQTSSIFNAVNAIHLKESHGVQYTNFDSGSPYDIGLLPSVSIKNNSFARMLHVISERTSTSLLNYQPLKGAAIEVVGNSKLALNGSNRFATRIIGPTTYASQSRKAGLYAGGGSEIEIAGPTVIAQYAIDALAEDGSKITFTAPKDNDGRLDILTYNLSSPANHTMVELHSTRACLVANRNSEINMKDLGDFTTTWARSTLGASAILSGADYAIGGTGLNYSPYVSAGSMQLYPNPDGLDMYTPGIANISFSNSNKNFQTGIYGNYYYLNSNVGVPSATNSFSGTTAGGVCVEAVNNSIINVQNVNFPCGWWNPSSIIYDISGSNGVCDRLFIWEVKDNSQLNANYCSVSGLFPESAGYIGPEGAWKTAAGVFVSSAPVGTPDTSSLSVLDYFGQCSSNPYGKSTPQNFGPFRLYFSTDPAVNWLASSSLDDYGRPAQVFAQGYQMSGNMIATGSVSAQYPSLLMKNSNGDIVASGFYYGSSIMNNPNSVRAILDESAGDTFANARHCTVGKSGLGRVVYIYFPYKNTPGGDSALNSVKNMGKGFRSNNSFDLERDN